MYGLFDVFIISAASDKSAGSEIKWVSDDVDAEVSSFHSQ